MPNCLAPQADRSRPFAVTSPTSPDSDHPPSRRVASAGGLCYDPVHLGRRRPPPTPGRTAPSDSLLNGAAEPPAAVPRDAGLPTRRRPRPITHGRTHPMTINLTSAAVILWSGMLV